MQSLDSGHKLKGGTERSDLSDLNFFLHFCLGEHFCMCILPVCTWYNISIRPRRYAKFETQAKQRLWIPEDSILKQMHNKWEHLCITLSWKSSGQKTSKKFGRLMKQNYIGIAYNQSLLFYVPENFKAHAKRKMQTQCRGVGSYKIYTKKERKHK